MEKPIKSYYFIGICGVAMAQMAAWLKQQGHKVFGSDQGAYPPMSDFLQSEGIEILTPYHESNLTDADFVIIGNALSRGNPEVETVLEKRIPYLSLPGLIHKEILAKKLPVVVSGTHGKTTTTAILAHILKHCGRSGGYMIGGLPVGWQSGFKVDEGDWFVIEGDEYDTAFFDKRPKFLHYRPQIALVNNIEFDHADIYASIEEIITQFQRLVRLIPGNGCLVANGDEEILEGIIGEAHCPVVKFGRGTSSQVQSELIKSTPEGMQFTVRFSTGKRYKCNTTLWGEHQLMNLTGAAATAEAAGAPAEGIVEAIASFRGVHRRLELIHSEDGIWIYDDFAHHPTSVKSTLASLRSRHPDLPVIAALEPRSNTMVRRYLQEELIEALALADYVAIGGVHRLQQIPVEDRINVDTILAELVRKGKKVFHNDDATAIISWIMQEIPQEAVIVSMSNGSFSGLVSRLKQELSQKHII